MTSLPIQSGPSETLNGAIAWFGQISATLFADPRADQVELSHEAHDHVASLLHFYSLLEADHNNWSAQLPDCEPTPEVREIANKYAISFRNWHAAALALLKVAKRLAAGGHEIPGLEALQDCIGFCPYIDVSIEKSILNARDSLKVIPQAEVRDGLRRRLHAEGC